MSYNVKLNVYEGPLDLCCFSLSAMRSTSTTYHCAYYREYLDYIHLMQSMIFQLAGEFILMAALLMRIKVQMLLPQPEVEKLEDVEDRAPSWSKCWWITKNIGTLANN
jgi:segregation and condensation protein A